MRSGSQGNQDPGLPAGSPAYTAALVGGSTAACFRPAAAAKIPVSLRFPAPRQPPGRPGLSIPAPNQKKLRAARDRSVRRPAPLRARSDKQPARRSGASGPPRIQNLDPALRPHPAAGPRTPAKPLSPGPRRVRRCAPRNMPLPSGCSKFFLDDHNSRSGPFIRGKFLGDRKPASPNHNPATPPHPPALTPERVTFLSFFQPARQRAAITILSATRWLRPRLHMPCPELPVARLDAFHNSSHHPLAQCHCLPCLLCALSVKFFFLPRLEQFLDADSRSLTALLNQRTHAFFRDGDQECVILSCQLRECA